MTPEQFCYWFQGKCEDRSTLPDAAEWASIKAHLDLVFEKATKPQTIPPTCKDPAEKLTEKEQADLSKILMDEMAKQRRYKPPPFGLIRDNDCIHNRRYC